MNDYMNDYQPSIRRATLNKLRVTLAQVLDEYLLDANVEIVENVMRKQVELHLRGYVLADDDKVIDICYPSDWWQALKERWFPKWLLRRYPVRYTQHHITARNIYPELMLKLPNEKHVMKIDVWRTDA